MEDKKTSLIYRIIRWLVWLFYPKTKFVGAENIPAEASVIVGNHTQMNGPIVGELYFPGKKYIWCAGEMLAWKDVHGYAFLHLQQCAHDPGLARHAARLHLPHLHAAPAGGEPPHHLPGEGRAL